MNNEKMLKEKIETPVKNQARKDSQKSKKGTTDYHKMEIIDIDELEERNGFTGDCTPILSAFLQKFDHREGHINYSKKLKDLAIYIYEKEMLYIPKHGGYKLMEVSSIETELSNLRTAQKELQKSREEEFRQNRKSAKTGLKKR